MENSSRLELSKFKHPKVGCVFNLKFELFENLGTRLGLVLHLDDLNSWKNIKKKTGKK